MVGVGLVVLGAAGMTFGLLGEGTTGLVLIGGGILAVLIGIALMSAWLGKPVLLLFGVVYRRLFGTVGSLAAQNALRNPRRTAATASALMIGLALMAMMSIFGTSASASTDAAIGKTLTSQFIISNVVGQSFSPDVAAQVRKLDGVQAVTQVRQAFPEIEGGRGFVAAMDPRTIRFAFAVPMTEGTLADLRPGTVAVTEREAKDKGLDLGDTVTMKFQGGDVKLRVVAIFGQAPVLPGQLPRHAGHLGQGRPRAAGLDGLRDQGAERGHRHRAGGDRAGHQGPADGHRQGPRGVRRGAEEAGQPVPLPDLRSARALGDHRDPRASSTPSASR